MQAIISNKDIDRLLRRLAVTDKTLLAVGRFMQGQVEDRFRSQGASGGKAWAQKRMRSWGYDDGRSILTGASATLRRSFLHRVEGNAAIVGSFVPYAKTQQLGTVGKGGILPTIRPKRAKALFIPITDRAINSARLTGQDANDARKKHGIIIGNGPYRVGTKGNRSAKTISLTQLVKGRLKDGKLEKQDRNGKWKPGVPDFIFLRKVDITPRPMLPNSPAEIEQTVKFVVSMMMTQK